MPNTPFRFLHAADLHLDQPLLGIAEVPEHLQDCLIDAPLAAARRVFEIAIREQVEFILLAGDVIDVDQAGARALAFLSDQLERVTAEGIEVFWAGGEVDGPDRWPRELPLPAGVHMFRPQVESVNFCREEEPIASIYGVSGGARVPVEKFPQEQLDLFTIGLAHGRISAEDAAKSEIGYWALGGEHRRRVVRPGSRPMVYAGSPQGRSPRDAGSHGCTLVQVDEQETRISELEADAVRWHHKPLRILEGSSKSDLQRQIREAMQKISTEATERTLLVRFTLEGAWKLADKMSQREICEELAAWLRKDYGHRDPAIWTVDIVWEAPPNVPASWRKEDTILGDFLRAVHSWQVEPGEPLEIDSFLPSEIDPELARRATSLEADARDQVLRRVALLGADLLRSPVEQPTMPETVATVKETKA